ncbi:MAG: four helix bundle protein [Ignavibacteriae bacterium]|nr:MAG: four helix bundle protein [Ignavibacteriota bacterium]
MSNPSNLRVYNTAGEIADEIALLVRNWPEFDQRSMGMQIIRAADSIGNNISEGYGRLSTGERMQFFFYADSSLQEVRNKVKRSVNRGLVDPVWAKEFDQRLLQLSISIIEFCWSIIERDTTYKGPYRERIQKRMWWRNKRSSTSSPD